MKRRDFLRTSAATLVLAGCQGVRADPAKVSTAGLGPAAGELIELYRSALAAGEPAVVVYGAAQEYYSRAYEVFQARFPGIDIRYQSIFGAPLLARLDQEFSSGARVGCIQLAAALPTAAAVRAGRTAPIAPFTATLPPELVGEGGAFARFGYWPHGIEYNRTLVGSAAPQSLAELVEPEWSGRLVMQNPTTNNGTSNSIALWLQRGLVDEEWVGALAAQQPRIESTVSLAEQVVARGERAVMLTNYAPGYVSLRRRGIDMGFRFPVAEGARLEPQNVTLLAQSPAPRSSELFVNWLFTPEGQSSFAGVGNYPVLPGQPGPADLPAPQSLPEPIAEIPVPEFADISAATIALIRTYFGQ